MLLCIYNFLGEKMKDKKRSTYSVEFRLEVAQLVVDQGYSIIEASKAMGASKSAVSKWVKQLKSERNGISDQPNALTPEQIKIKELEKRIKRIELEKEILKKATALLMSESMNGLR